MLAQQRKEALEMEAAQMQQESGAGGGAQMRFGVHGPFGCGSKPTVPFWGSCTTHFGPFLVGGTGSNLPGTWGGHQFLHGPTGGMKWWPPGGFLCIQKPRARGTPQSASHLRSSALFGPRHPLGHLNANCKAGVPSLPRLPTAFKSLVPLGIL